MTVNTRIRTLAAIKLTYFNLIIILFLFNSCGHRKNSSQEDPSARPDIDSILTITKDKGERVNPQIKIPPFIQLIGFKQSLCIDDSLIETNAKTNFTKLFKGDTLFVRANAMAECPVQYIGDIEFRQDSLILLIKEKGVLKKNKNGIFDTVFYSHNCFCRYNFNYTILNLSKMPKSIKLEKL